MREIPEFVYSFSMKEAIIWSVVIWLAVASVISIIAIAENHKKSPELSLHKKISPYTILCSLIGGLVIAFVPMVALAFMSGLSGNTAEVKTAVIERIGEVYDLDLNSEEITIYFEYKTGSSEKSIKEVNTTHDDLDTGTRYDLVFVFKDNKEPILLKTGNVTEELVKELMK